MPNKELTVVPWHLMRIISLQEIMGMVGVQINSEDRPWCVDYQEVE